MTTEVLRNMMYAGSPHAARARLRRHGRGALPRRPVPRARCGRRSSSTCPSDVQVVSLSATVSNAEEFGDWLAEVRGDTEVIVSEHRPVPLWQHMMVGQDDATTSSSTRPPRPPRPWTPPRQPRPRWRPCGEPEQRGRALYDGPDRGRRRGRVARGTGGRRGPGGGAGGRGFAARWPLRRRGDPRRGDRATSTATACCRRSPSSSAGSAATPRCGQLLPDGMRLIPRAARASGSAASSRSGCRPCADEDLAVLGYWDFVDGPRAGLRRPPRRDAADVPRDRRGAVHRRPDPGGVRHRDAGPGHQHAGAHRGAREAGQVQRRDPRRHHARRSTPS